jgi:hypothetical protein
MASGLTVARLIVGFVAAGCENVARGWERFWRLSVERESVDEREK